MLLEIRTIVFSIVPVVFIVYLCRISNKKKETKKFISYISSFVFYTLFIIAFDKATMQLFITGVYSSIVYFLYKKELEKIKKEHNEAILDKMEASYQKYAVNPRRRNG
ncbi:hypothetical protein [Volucribacter amazonae]|uniref:Uncharacterized protein n=1 Tax=Volucribacter amazonae TaxID=256731 RepID=A0A9X4SJ71_9PAST|nr:hypothetical protein [Volucribacter amazonae]MDG6896397.1 hypothetical protein [Volucribacter amazonae]